MPQDLSIAQTIYVTNRLGTTGLNMGRKLEVQKVLSTMPLRLSTMPLRVQDTISRFQHSVWNSCPIKWNAVIERENIFSVQY